VSLQQQELNLVFERLAKAVSGISLMADFVKENCIFNKSWFMSVCERERERERRMSHPSRLLSSREVLSLWMPLCCDFFFARKKYDIVLLNKIWIGKCKNLIPEK
jgi:hypothetical protein